MTRRKNSRKLLIPLVLFMLVLLVPLVSAEKSLSGVCGDQLVWNYDISTRCLTISGVGEMWDYDSGDQVPWTCWNNQSDGAKTVIIGNGVTYIGSCAFEGFHWIEEVTISNTVRRIGDYAFRLCNGLKKAPIPVGMESIGDYAFYCCYELENFNIPESIKSIGRGSLEECRKLESITIPKSVTNIGLYAFYKCEGISFFSVDTDNRFFTSDEKGCLYTKDKTILIQYPIGNLRSEFSIPEEVVTIGEGAFGLCPYLKKIIIPFSVTDINEFAFYVCSELTEILIPNNVLTIGDYAFADCVSIQSLTIFDGVQSIGESAFRCTSINTLSIPNSVVYLGEEAFSGCELLAEVTISKQIKELNFGIFQDCIGLTTISIPNGVTIIKGGVFAGCNNLLSVTIPDSITCIQYGALSYCEMLSTIYYEGSEEQWSQILKYDPTISDLTIQFLGDSNPHSHVWNNTSVVSATCISTGVLVCSCSCGERYTEVIAIDPNNHVNTIDVAAIASTCTVKGYTAGKYCNDCKQYINGHQQQSLVAHTITRINQKDATYEEEGYTGDEYCTTCKQIIYNGTVIPKLEGSDDSQPTQNLNFFQRIIQWFRNLFARLFGR